jgi:hypothetical protein
VRRKGTSRIPYSNISISVAIKDALYVEEPKLSFNYFGMHKCCIDILRLIKAKEHHRFVQYFTTGYMPDETLISNVVILVHHVALQSSRAGQMMGVVPDGALQQSRMVIGCGEVMKECLAKNGDVACNAIKLFCKNKSLGDAPKLLQQENEYLYWISLEDVLDHRALESLKTGLPVAW